MNTTARRVVVGLAALAAALGTARLGLWQLDRADEKTALQRSIAERGALPPLDSAALARDAAAAATQWQRRVTLEGRWRPEFTLYLENRQIGDGQPGFYVLTPLQLADGSAVAVQRGWQPRDLLDRTRVAEVPSPAGPVQLLGRVAPPPSRLFDFGADAVGRIRQNVALDAWSAETGLALRPLSVWQLDAPGTPADGLRRDWPAPAVDVERHRGYAVQWFSLSALVTGLYVWFQLLRPRRQRAR